MPNRLTFLKVWYLTQSTLPDCSIADPDAALIDDNEQELNMFDDEESGYIDMSLLPAEDMSLIRHFDCLFNK